MRDRMSHLASRQLKVRHAARRQAKQHTNIRAVRRNRRWLSRQAKRGELAHGFGCVAGALPPNVRHERQTQAQLEAVRSMEGLEPGVNMAPRLLLASAQRTASARLVADRC
jgi:hypothetical protein